MNKVIALVIVGAIFWSTWGLLENIYSLYVIYREELVREFGFSEVAGLAQFFDVEIYKDFSADFFRKKVNLIERGRYWAGITVVVEFAIATISFVSAFMLLIVTQVDSPRYVRSAGILAVFAGLLSLSLPIQEVFVSGARNKLDELNLSAAYYTDLIINEGSADVRNELFKTLQVKIDEIYFR